MASLLSSMRRFWRESFEIRVLEAASCHPVKSRSGFLSINLLFFIYLRLNASLPPFYFGLQMSSCARSCHLEKYNFMRQIKFNLDTAVDLNWFWPRPPKDPHLFNLDLALLPDLCEAQVQTITS